MNIYARWAVAVLAVVIAVGGAAYFLAPAGGGIGGPPATASPSPSAAARASATPAPTIAPSRSPAILAIDGDVFQGTYTPAFDPPLTFTIDKEVQHRCAAGFVCRGSIDVNQPAWLGLEFGQPKIEVNISRIDKIQDPAHPKNLIDPPVDLAGWIAKLPGITLAAPPKAVTVGGLAGTQLDIHGGSKDVNIGPIPGVTEFGVGIGHNETVRWIVVPVRGRQVIIKLGGQDPFSTSMDELQPLVDSIVWN